MAVPLEAAGRAAGAVTSKAAVQRLGMPGRPQIPALTGLRFFAAFFILFAHAFDWIAQFQDSHVSEYFSVVAMYGMPLFFVLSGFVIHYNYRDLFLNESIGKAICEFAAARFARLYPLYLVFLLMALAADDFLLKIYHSRELALPILTYYLTLTQSWWYLIYGGKSIIYWLFSVSWSISTEMYFYAVFAATVFFIFALSKRGRIILIGLVYAALVLAVLGAARYELETLMVLAQRYVADYIAIDADFENSFYRWLFYFSPYVRVLEFILGCFTAQALLDLSKRKVSPREHRWAAVALIFALASLVGFGLLYLGVFALPIINSYVQFFALNFLCAPSIAIVLFYVARYDSPFSRAMSSPPLVTLGETSYSIYLVHSWTLRIFERTPPNLTPLWAADAIWRIACGIGLTLVVSYGTYRLIELPGRIWLRRILRRGISWGFDRRRLRPRPFADPTGVAPRLHLTCSRVVYSGLALSGLLMIAFVGQAARSEQLMVNLHRFLNGQRPEVEVISASYGTNCREFPVRAPFPNLASPGNATVPTRQACNGKTECDLEVSVDRFGDPANGCGKDFLVEYRCSGRPNTLSGYLPGEADGKHILLQCPARVSISAGNAEVPPVSHTQ
jgi:peptidoglycan/LPS O-acetylase OafA/YrhL